MNTEQTRDIIRKVRQIEIRTRRLVTDTLAGQYHSVFKGRGMNFDSVREYVPGDEVRTIDWNVTARAGHPFVKKFIEERELTLLLMVDVSASGDFGSGIQSKRELAAEVASVLAFSAVKNSDKVGLLLFSDQVELYVPPRKGRRHVLRMVREVLGFEPARHGTDLVQALDFVNDVVKRRAIVFLISDFQTGRLRTDFENAQAVGELRKALRQTNRRHDLVALPIEDPREQELPDLGIIAIEDAETGELVELDTRNPGVRRRFAEVAHERAAQLRHAFNAESVDALRLSTGQPYVAGLMNFFKTRARKRSPLMNSFPHFFIPVLRKAAAGMVLCLVALTTFAAPPPGAPPATSPQAVAAAPPANDEIHDIRAPIHIEAPVPWLWWGAGTVAAAALAYGLRKALHRPHLKSAHELALENLEKMRPLMRPETTRLFSQAVSEVVRRFIESSLPVRAAHRTTAEFLHDLVNYEDGPLAVHREMLAHFLGHCDLAKFARWSLTREQMEEMLQSARAFVIAVGSASANPTRKPSSPESPRMEVMASMTSPH